MQVNIFSQQKSIFNRFIAEIRDSSIQTDPMRFRRNLERMGEVFAYEISKVLPYNNSEVKTPLGVANVELPDTNVVVASILRAGLPLHQGLLNYFDRADNAFVSAYRKYTEDGEFDIHIEYISSPSLDNRVMLLSDPMLASGNSMDLAYKALMQRGKPSHVHVIAIIASKVGLEYVKNMLKGEPVTLWIGAIDDELNAKSYIVPGLGDAGDLAFGTKL